jgi:anti-anti-sigma factor
MAHHPPTIEVRWPRPDVVQVVLGGEQDRSAADQLAQTLATVLVRCRHLIVDLTEAEFIDATILRVFVNAKKQADESDRRFNLLVGSTPIIETVLDVTSLNDALNRARTFHEALAVEGVG